MSDMPVTGWQATADIEDVELEDENLDKSVDELIEEQQSERSEVVAKWFQDDTTDGAEEDGDPIEKADTDDEDDPLEVTAPRTDGELIKRVGIAQFGVDTTDPDKEALDDLVNKAEFGEVEIGLEGPNTGDAALDAVASAGVPTDLEKESLPIEKLSPEEQATKLASDVVDDLELGKLAEKGAQLHLSPDDIRKRVQSKAAADITKYVDTIYGIDNLNREAFKQVRDRLSTDVGNAAKVRAAMKGQDSPQEATGGDTAATSESADGDGGEKDGKGDEVDPGTPNLEG